MAALMPRIFGDVGDWFEAGFPMFGTHPIRVEDFWEKDRYVLRAELPGMDPDKDISVTVDGGVLTVSAERTEESRDKQRSEFRYGSFRRSVRLPDGVDLDKVTATYDKGILEVTIPLPTVERAAAQKIAIQKV